MLNYIIRRILLMIPTILGITAVVFFVMAASPGGVGGNLLNELGEMEAEKQRALKEYYQKRYGLDQPPPVQYIRWLNRVSPIGFKTEDTAEGEKLGGFGFKMPDLGKSFSQSREVLDMFGDALPITLLLNLVTLPIIYGIAIVAGVYAARHRGKFFDVTSGSFLLGLWSVPIIWAGVLCIGFLASRDFLKLFPAGNLSSTGADDMPFLPTWNALGRSIGYTLYAGFLLMVPVGRAIIGAVLFWIAAKWSARNKWLGVASGVCAAIVCFWFLVWPLKSIGVERAWVLAPAAWLIASVFMLWPQTRLPLFGVGIGIAMWGIGDAVLAVDVLPTQMPADRGWLIDRAWHLVLPIACLTYGGFAFLAKLMRASLLENLSADYVRTARAKGVDDTSVLWHHGVRNSLIPMITVAAGILPSLIAGSLIVENIFNIRGMGLVTYEAIVARDREIVLAGALISGVLGMVSILVADICYLIADPRVSYE